MFLIVIPHRMMNQECSYQELIALYYGEELGLKFEETQPWIQRQGAVTTAL
jgi:hypothetical protein